MAIPKMVKRNDRVWFSGPPPFPGWWNASTDYHLHVWRWWDGTKWSLGCANFKTGKHAGACALRPARHAKAVFWTKYWPEGARVPRLPPGALNLNNPLPQPTGAPSCNSTQPHAIAVLFVFAAPTS